MGSCLEWVELDPESTVDREIMQRQHEAVIERLEDGAPEEYPPTRPPMGTRVGLGRLPVWTPQEDHSLTRVLSKLSEPS